MDFDARLQTTISSMSQADSTTLRSVTSSPISRPLPLRLQVAERLKELILAGELHRGEHLVESELARALGVSRQPIREALQLLARDRWVDLRIGFGAFVHMPSTQEIDDVFRVRSALEGEAAARAAARVADGSVTRAALKPLRGMLRNGPDVLSAEERVIVKANQSFHAQILALSGNQVLAEMAATIEQRVRWYFSAVAVKRAPSSWDEHAEVVEAIEAGDEARAGKAMRDHCERSRLALVRPLDV